MKGKTYRVVVESHVVVQATSEKKAREYAETNIRQAIETHPLLYPFSPFVFDPNLMRNSFLAGKVTPVEPVAND